MKDMRRARVAGETAPDLCRGPKGEAKRQQQHEDIHAKTFMNFMPFMVRTQPPHHRLGLDRSDR